MYIYIVNAMKIIKRSYPAKLYRWPIGEDKESDIILKWKSNLNQSLIVFHPFLAFDPISTYSRQKGILARGHSSIEILKRKYITELEYTPIVHEEIRADFNFFSNLESLLAIIEHNFKIPKDAWLWYDTGYWTAKSRKFSYMGISEDSALQVWSRNNEITLSYVASSTSVLLEFRLDKHEENAFVLNVYYTNRFVVFPDLIDTVHRALNCLGPWEIKKTETTEHDKIFDIGYHQGYSNEMVTTLTFPIIPIRVIALSNNPAPGSDFLYAVLVKNTFFKIPGCVTKPEGYAILTYSGGWLKQDFDRGKLFEVGYARIMKLGFCCLVSLSVKEHYKDDN